MWNHKSKHRGKFFKGRYIYVKKERVFQLAAGARIISFESWQMAKTMGWKKIA